MDGQLQVEYQQPFDLIADANGKTTNTNADLGLQIGENENWRAFLHDYRTLCAAPTPNLKALFIDLQKLDFDTDDRAVAC